MKKKPTILISVLTVFLVIITFSCHKFENIQENTTEQEAALNEANFSPEFDWESSRSITLSFSSANAQIVTVSSTDKSIRYYKGVMANNVETYIVKISVPSNVKKLNINNQEVDLNSDNISINL